MCNLICFLYPSSNKFKDEKGAKMAKQINTVVAKITEESSLRRTDLKTQNIRADSLLTLQQMFKAAGFIVFAYTDKVIADEAATEATTKGK